MLHIATRLGAEQPARCLRATLIPTAKNDPCRRFFDGAGLSSVGELTYEWDLATRFPAPADITIELSATTPARAGG